MPPSVQAASGGADLNRPVDTEINCERSRLQNPATGEYEPFDGFGDAFRYSSCTMWSFTTDPNTGSSLGLPGTGTVTKVRVKSGPNPAPLQVAIVRNLVQRNPQNPNEIRDQSCCTVRSVGPVFQPTPNAVTETVVNLPFEQVAAQGNLSGWNDLLAVSALNATGTLPISSTGPHTAFAGNVPTVNFSYPKLNPGDYSDGSFAYPNYQLLMQYDTAVAACPGAAAADAKASQACTKTPVTPARIAPASVLSKSLKLKKGKVKISVRCTLPKGQRCKGRVSLRTAAKKPKALAGKSLNVKGTKKATVTLGLSKKARKRVRKKKNKVTAVINMGAQGTKSKNLILKR